MMLHIQEYLRNGGTVEELKQEPYCLSISETQDLNRSSLIGFKYDQIRSDMNLDICQEARGLILDKEDNWNVVSYPFRKFFNMGQSEAHDIDWDTATLYEKMDGSCAVLYFYRNQWYMHTLGTVDGGGEVLGRNEFNRSWDGETFSDLFWDAWSRNEVELSGLNSEVNYIFELCTPLNQIVVDYGDDFNLTLVGARNRDTLQEYGVEEFQHLFPIPTQIDASRLDSHDPNAVRYLIDQELNALDEGFVICDANFNRVKVKSEAYLFAHRSRSKVMDRKYGFLEQLLLDNHDDIIGIYPKYERVFDRLRGKIRTLAQMLESYYGKCDGYATDPQDPQQRKGFALCAQKFPLRGAVKYLFQRLESQSEDFESLILKEEKYRKLGQLLDQIED